MNAHEREAFDKMAARLDAIDAQCRGLKKMRDGGITITRDEAALLDRWEAEGCIPWRKNGRVIARLRAAARLTVKNQKKRAKKRRRVR